MLMSADKKIYPINMKKSLKYICLPLKISYLHEKQNVKINKLRAHNNNTLEE